MSFGAARNIGNSIWVKVRCEKSTTGGREYESSMSALPFTVFDFLSSDAKLLLRILDIQQHMLLFKDCTIICAISHSDYEAERFMKLRRLLPAFLSAWSMH